MERKKKATISAEKDIIAKVVRGSLSSDDSGDECELDELSRTELIRKVKQLKRKLDYEKTRQQLCNGKFLIIVCN